MKRILRLVLLLLSVAAPALAGGYRYVEPEELKQWLEIKKPMTIVDIQTPADFLQHHFRGALETNAFPVKSDEDRGKLDKVLPLLAASRDDVVIVCPRGGKGAQGAYTYLKEKGVDEKRLYILTDGMSEWHYPEMTIGAGK